MKATEWQRLFPLFTEESCVNLGKDGLERKWGSEDGKVLGSVKSLVGWVGGEFRTETNYSWRRDLLFEDHTSLLISGQSLLSLPFYLGG